MNKIEPRGLAAITSEIMAHNQKIINQSQSDLAWQEDSLTFTEIIRQEYSNCVFSAGAVSGHPIDTVYLKLERDGRIDTFLLLRPDEMAAIGWLSTGVLWSLAMKGNDDA